MTDTFQKTMHKMGFEWLFHSFHILKSSLICLPPNGPEKSQKPQSDSQPTFLPPLSYIEPVPT